MRTCCENYRSLGRVDCPKCGSSLVKTLAERWEQGVPHHPRSKEIYEAIAKADFEVGGDYFAFKSGGDGDNGEHLMYLLDHLIDSGELK